MKIVNLAWMVTAAFIFAACGRTVQSDPNENSNAGVGTGGESSASNTGGNNTSSSTGGVVDNVGAMGGAIGIGPAVGGAVSMPGVRIGGPGVILPGGINSVDAPPPKNCVPASEYSSTTDCGVDLSCDNDWVYTYCYLESGDTWYCDCGSSYRSMSFQVSTSNSSSVCTTISGLCSAEEVPVFTEPATCTTDYQSLGADYCDLGMTCTTSVDAGDGITAQQNSYKSANCYVDGGQLMCQCSNSQVYRSYQISGVGITSSCQLAMDLCDSGDEPVFSDPPACSNTYQDASDGYCHEEQQCRSTAEVSDGVTAVLDDYQYVDCQDLGNGSAACHCSSSQGYMSFETLGLASDLNTCSGALQVCSSADAIALSGPIECARSYQSASAQYCDAQLTCKQAGTLDSQELVVYGDLYVNCSQQTADGPWTCTCSSGQQSASFEVAAADGWDVCSMYAETCPTAIDVQIGMSGGGGFYGRIPPGGLLIK